MHKIAITGVIDEGSWEKITKTLAAMTKVTLTPEPPRFENPNQVIELTQPGGATGSLSLLELESLLSPGLILLPGTPGVIAPIRREYADQLLGTSEPGPKRVE